MRFTITPPIGGTAYVLADDTGPYKLPPGVNYQNGLSGHILEGYVPRHDTLIQKTNLVRAANPFGAARLNQTVTIRFTVTRIFSAIPDCLAFLDDLPYLVPLQGEMCRSNSTAGQVQNRYLPLAFRETIECVEQIGVRCKVRYQFWAPSAWQPNP